MERSSIKVSLAATFRWQSRQANYRPIPGSVRAAMGCQIERRGLLGLRGLRGLLFFFFFLATKLKRETSRDEIANSVRFFRPMARPSVRAVPLDRCCHRCTSGLPSLACRLDVLGFSNRPREWRSARSRGEWTFGCGPTDMPDQALFTRRQSQSNSCRPVAAQTAEPTKIKKKRSRSSLTN